jgi:hypothetical protein
VLPGGRDLKGDANAKKGFFTLAKNSASTELTVEIWPYKGGSKTVVIAKVPLHPTVVETGKRTVDVKKVVDEAKQEIENIVKG